MRYEYIRVPFDLGDLSELNNYSMNGWRVVQILKNPNYAQGGLVMNQEYALLERPIPGGYNISPSEIAKVFSSKAAKCSKLLRKLLCKIPPFGFHQYILIEEYDEYTRKLLCTSCNIYFAMSDRHQAVLPWNDEFEELTRIMYDIPRSKI